MPFLALWLMMVIIKLNNPSCSSDHFQVSGHFKNTLLLVWPGIITFGSLYSLKTLAFPIIQM